MFASGRVRKVCQVLRPVATTSVSSALSNPAVGSTSRRVRPSELPSASRKPSTPPPSRVANQTPSSRTTGPPTTRGSRSVAVQRRRPSASNARTWPPASTTKPNPLTASGPKVGTVAIGHEPSGARSRAAKDRTLRSAVATKNAGPVEAGFEIAGLSSLRSAVTTRRGLGLVSTANRRSIPSESTTTVASPSTATGVRQTVGRERSNGGTNGSATERPVLGSMR